MSDSPDPLDSSARRFSPGPDIEGERQLAKSWRPDQPTNAHSHSTKEGPLDSTSDSDAGNSKPEVELNTSRRKSSAGASNAGSKAEPPYSLLADSRRLIPRFLWTYIRLIIMFMGLLSPYWGSLYRRENRVANMDMLVVIEDSSVTLTNSTLAPALLGPQFGLLLSAVPQLGKFEFANITEFKNQAQQHNRTVFELITHKIHQQEYWAAFYINSLASQTVYDYLAGDFNASAELPYIILTVYESGRHFSALSQYVTKSLREIGRDWLAYYCPQSYAAILTEYLNQTQQAVLVSALNLTSSPSPMQSLAILNMVDLRPSLSSAVLGPSELGLIYAQMFAFHQFNFAVELHSSVLEKLIFPHWLLYRVVFSQVNYLVLGLVYALLTIAFQVPIDPAYGGPGFLVLWMTMFLFMSASGGIMETLVSLINFYEKKMLLPPLIIFTIVINISPTFAPFVLSPGFYRYGYAMPMFNAYEALKVIFFNTSKKSLGRNYGVLAIWVVITHVGLVFVLRFINRKAQERAKAKKAAARAEKSSQG